MSGPGGFRKARHITVLVKMQKTREQKEKGRKGGSKNHVSNEQIIKIEKEAPTRKINRLPKHVIVSSDPDLNAKPTEAKFDIDTMKDYKGFEGTETIVMYEDGCVYPVISNETVQKRIKQVAAALVKMFKVSENDAHERTKAFYLRDAVDHCWRIGHDISVKGLDAKDGKDLFSTQSKKECYEILGALLDRTLSYYYRKLEK